MIKFYFTSFFILFLSIGFSQSYPYLNASTGNENEFPVDKDTNIYMFHGNRLVKTDKNFNVIWANTYSGINFLSLLLSKTGSLYFTGVASSSFQPLGKINPNGTLAWVKNTGNIVTASVSTGAACERIFLDRNNNLICTGGTYGSSGTLLKIDTNGVGLRLVEFTGMYSYLGGLSIVTDSSGYYKLFGFGLKPLNGHSFGMLTFSDLTNTVTNIKEYSLTSMFYNVKWKFVRSKRFNNFYARVATDIPGSFLNLVYKFSLNGGVKWSEPINLAGLYWSVYHLEDDDMGNVLASLSNYNSSSNHTSFVTKLDSLGIVNNRGMKMLNGYFVYNIMTNNYDIPSHASRVIHNNNYYFDISGYSFPGNPLTIHKFNTTFSTPCTPTLVINGGAMSLGTSSIYTPTVTIIPSFTIGSYSSSVTPIAFSVNTNFCTVLETTELGKSENVKVFPNPANDKLYINNINKSVNAVEIFDLNGKSIFKADNDSSINIKDFSHGIYFIRITTDKGEFNKKFVKE